MRRRSVLAGFVALIGLAAAAAPRAQTPAPRVVAIGDIHGSLDGVTAILRSTGLTGSDGRWTGGATTFVQTGDVTDRGAACAPCSTCCGGSVPRPRPPADAWCRCSAITR